MWALCGMSDESKADPDMDTRTIKAAAGMTTNPIPVDDGESTKKVSFHIFVASGKKIVIIKISGRQACYLCTLHMIELNTRLRKGLSKILRCT